MRYERITLSDGSTGRILARLDPGDEILTSVKDLARREAIPSGFVSGLGAVEGITLAFYDRSKRVYEETRLEEELEVVSMTGNIAWIGDEPIVHLHGVVSRRDATTAAGHFMRGIVSATLEVMVIVNPERIYRRAAPEIGLNLLDLGLPGPG